MESISRCLLLPIDGTGEALGTVDFLSSLYPERERIDIILCYFLPQLPPIYRERHGSQEMARRKQEHIESRTREARSILDQARKVIEQAGFPKHAVQEHVEEKVMGMARQACMLAELKKVDAVVVQRSVSSALEGFIKGDSAPSLLQHCIVSPVWLTEGSIDVSRAAICVYNNSTSLRAVDHAAFMLAETDTGITILHLTPSVSYPISSDLFSFNPELQRWLMTPEGKEMRPCLEESRRIMEREGIAQERVRVAILPNSHDTASDILAYCRRQGIGIVALGYSGTTGTWGFLKNTIAKKLISELKDMSVWITQ